MSTNRTHKKVSNIARNKINLLKSIAKPYTTNSQLDNSIEKSKISFIVLPKAKVKKIKNKSSKKAVQKFYGVSFKNY